MLEWVKAALIVLNIALVVGGVVARVVAGRGRSICASLKCATANDDAKDGAAASAAASATSAEADDGDDDDDDAVELVVVTAHPDDESMFFAPLIVGWTGAVHVVCLTDGGYDGLGRVRAKELAAAGSVLGLASTRVGPFADDPTGGWNADEVQGYLYEAVSEIASAAESGRVVVASFDGGGVSGHVNHVAAGCAVEQLARAGVPGVASFIALDTVSLARKYVGYAGVPLSLAFDASAAVTVVSGPASYVCAFRAMLAHRTQLVWYRWLYLLFSSYMVLNTYTRLGSRR